MNHILDELEWRGLIAQTTDLDALRDALSAGPVTLYCGFDPTAPSLHIGNLVQILTVRRLQDAGHVPFGARRRRDRSDRRPEDGGGAHAQRPRRRRRAGWSASASRSSRCCASTARTPRRMVNNLDWTAPLSAIDFLRDIGKHYRLGTMLAKDTVARRLNSDAGHQLHRVQLPDPAGHGLPRAVPPARDHAADRRQRPVGQPALGRRADPQGRGRRRARADDAADHQGGRHQVRQDRDRAPSGSTPS